jgi:hypothetical protein
MRLVEPILEGWSAALDADPICIMLVACLNLQMNNFLFLSLCQDHMFQFTHFNLVVGN